MIVTERNYSDVMGRISQIPKWTWDLETDGLRPYAGSRLIGVAIEAAGEPYYFPFRHLCGVNLSYGHLLPFLGELTGPHALVGFNSIRFDAPMVAVEAPFLHDRLLNKPLVNHHDVIIMALLANENEPSFSLDSLGTKYLGAAAQKAAQQLTLMAALKGACPGLRAKRQLMGQMARLSPDQVAPYAEGDVLDTQALYVLYAKNLLDWSLTDLALEMFDYARLLARIEAKGMLVDREECSTRSMKCLDEQRILGSSLRRALGVNPGAPAQVARVFGTVDAKSETLLASGNPLAADVINYKRLGKMAKTYYQAMVALSDADGIVRPQMNLSRDPRDLGGTKSARLSCSNPNFQNLPVRSDDWYMRVRECVIARPGHVFLKNDYERQEMWIGAFYSGDQPLADAYFSDLDLYAAFAEEAGVSRADGKTAWLAIQYGIGAPALAKKFKWPHRAVSELEREFGIAAANWENPQWDVYMSQPASRLKQKFFKMCPGIKSEMKRITVAAETDGFTRLWTGRVIHFDFHYTFPFSGWNRVVQGGGGEMIRLAMQRLEKPLETVGAYQVLSVHDEIVVESPTESAAEAKAICQRVMVDFPFFKPFFPRVETKVGTNYGRMV